jgi:beta-glucan synthesis-associated protein KRE6
LTPVKGYPLLSHFLKKPEQTTQGGFNLGGINATGQIPDFTGNFGLIDRDTPEEVKTKKSYNSNEDLVLVFSDEFNRDGRTFWPGDDPYWEAVDLWYWGTVNLEWYDPMQGEDSLHCDEYPKTHSLSSHYGFRVSTHCTGACRRQVGQP